MKTLEKYVAFDVEFNTVDEIEHLIQVSAVSFENGIENDKIVCFFVLDSGTDKFKYSDNSRSLLLRAFSTDSRETRKGYARQSLLLLPKFLKTNYPTYNEIVLGVNEYNQVVTYLYANLNFVDTKTRFLGKKGYQKIMSFKV